MRCVLVGGVALLMAGLGAQAQTTMPPLSRQWLSRCEWNGAMYTAEKPGSIPQIIDAIGDGSDKIVFRVCTDATRNQHIFLREPRPNRNGVCRTFENEVFLSGESESIFIRLLYDGGAPRWYIRRNGWTQKAPAAWAAVGYSARTSVFAFVSDDPCPPGNDPRYMPVKNITDGGLKAFLAFWSQVRASPKAFDRSFANIAVKDLKPVDEEKRKERIAAFREEVFSSRAEPRLIKCAEDGGGCSALLGNFWLAFDVGEHGVEVQSLSSVLII